MGIPQIIMIVLLAMSGTMSLMYHGKQRPPYNFWLWLFVTPLNVGLLYWGGFFG